MKVTISITSCENEVCSFRAFLILVFEVIIKFGLVLTLSPNSLGVDPWAAIILKAFLNSSVATEI